ncbi:hypothetical protein [Pasteuria penetrans]|uniref:hypothetical protein n=1 Tax=Pasteuria penetrans TaxID=86005 RepID=UPI0011EE9F54|nr:hypothetical protein [Pasteuria penetrans]
MTPRRALFIMMFVVSTLVISFISTTSIQATMIELNHNSALGIITSMFMDGDGLIWWGQFPARKCFMHVVLTSLVIGIMNGIIFPGYLGRKKAILVGSFIFVILGMIIRYFMLEILWTNWFPLSDHHKNWLFLISIFVASIGFYCAFHIGGKDIGYKFIFKYILGLVLVLLISLAVDIVMRFLIYDLLLS